MVVFKRRITNMLLGLLIAPCTGIVVWIGLRLFMSGSPIPFLSGIAVALILVYSAIFSENIRFELEGDTLRYLKRGKLEHEFFLPHCAFRYRVVSERSFPPTYDITLYFTNLEWDPEGENEVYIDASPIGYSQFARMTEMIERRLQIPVSKLETVKK